MTGPVFADGVRYENLDECLDATIGVVPMMSGRKESTMDEIEAMRKIARILDQMAPLARCRVLAYLTELEAERGIDAHRTRAPHEID